MEPPPPPPPPSPPPPTPLAPLIKGVGPYKNCVTWGVQKVFFLETGQTWKGGGGEGVDVEMGLPLF